MAFAAICFGPLAGTADAKDPDGFGTGIIPGWPTEPVDLHVTPEQIAEKWARRDALTASLMQGGFSAAAATEQALPTSIHLTYTVYHQKTTYNCVPATGQSMAHYSFGGYNTPSVASVQSTIATAMKTRCDDTKCGTYDADGLSWLNLQYQNHGSTWRYAFARPATSTYFKGWLMSENGDVRMPMYARVDLSSRHYVWFQPVDSKGKHPLHATAVIGYASSGACADSADPFKTPPGTGKPCVANSSYSATPDYGCRWGYTPNPLYPTSEYYSALDTWSGLSNLWM